jgi:hypothetical protein
MYTPDTSTGSSQDGVLLEATAVDALPSLLLCCRPCADDYVELQVVVHTCPLPCPLRDTTIATPFLSTSGSLL